MKVLAVCAGNICRSPAAEAAIVDAANAVGMKLEVDSAGTGAWNVGEPPTPEAIAAGAEAGLSITGRARRIHSQDFSRFDVILAMDRTNYRDLMAAAPNREDQAKIRLFRTYDPDSEEEVIDDPYGGTAEDYKRMVEEVMASARGFVNSLVSV